MTRAKKWRKLSRTSQHRKAMMSNMATSLLLYEKIKTTHPKAKDLQRFVDRLLTHSKPMNLAAHRYVATVVRDEKVQKKIFEVLVPRYGQRTSGYTRLFKCGQRMSDGAEMSIIQLIP